MPRKSAAALSVIPLDPGRRRLQPPSSLSEAERKVFVDLVSSCNPNHFAQSDMPLLYRYVEVVVLAEEAAKQLRRGPVMGPKVSPWLAVQEKSIRAMTALSMRLRLSPQARAPTTRVKAGKPGSYYDYVSDDD